MKRRSVRSTRGRFLALVLAITLVAIIMALAFVPLGSTTPAGTGSAANTKQVATGVTLNGVQSTHFTPTLMTHNGVQGTSDPVSGARSSPIIGLHLMILLLAAVLIATILIAYMTRTETNPKPQQTGKHRRGGKGEKRDQAGVIQPRTGESSAGHSSVMALRRSRSAGSLGASPI